MGGSYFSQLFFASQLSASVINIANFIDRIEILVMTELILTGFIKMSICLYVAVAGLSRIVNMKDYKAMTAPVAFGMMVFGITVYESTGEMFNWAFTVYQYYAIPFQIILPVFILIMSEIRVRKNKKLAPENEDISTQIITAKDVTAIPVILNET